MTHLADVETRIIDYINEQVGVIAQVQSDLLKNFGGDPYDFCGKFLYQMEWGSRVQSMYVAREWARLYDIIKNVKASQSDVPLWELLVSARDDLQDILCCGYANRSTNPYHNACADDLRLAQANVLERLKSFIVSLNSAVEKDKKDAVDLANGITRTYWKQMDGQARELLHHDLKTARVLTKLSPELKKLLNGGKTSDNPRVVRKHGALVSFGDFVLS
jgi:hypothetical protein